jgi:membrane protease YdiL (CAAX protease family)
MTPRASAGSSARTRPGRKPPAPVGAPPTRRGSASTDAPAAGCGAGWWIRVCVVFLGAWYALDRWGSSPPAPLAALTALAASLAILVAGEVLVLRTPWRAVGVVLGLGRPRARALLLAAAAGGAVVTGYVAGAALLGVRLELRPGWAGVLVAVLLFHGVAEETVWRGFAFGRLRRVATFRRALLLSIPLITLTHVPILLGSGWLVGTLAVLSAAITCVPLAWLYEHGDRTIWAPATLHGLIGTWQLFERPYPAQFSVVVLLASITIPLAALAVGRHVVDARPQRPAVVSLG